MNTGINELFEELGRKYINRFNIHQNVVDKAPETHTKVIEKEVILDEKKAKKIVLEADDNKCAKKKGCC